MKHTIFLSVLILVGYTQGRSQIDSLIGHTFAVKPFHATIELKADSTYEMYAPAPCIPRGRRDFRYGRWLFQTDSIILEPDEVCVRFDQLAYSSIKSDQFDSNDEIEIELVAGSLDMLAFGWPIILSSRNRQDTVPYRGQFPKIRYEEVLTIIISADGYRDIEIPIPDEISGGDRLVINIELFDICEEEKLFGSTDMKIPISAFGSNQPSTPYKLVKRDER